jgi:hypothetical protein
MSKDKNLDGIFNVLKGEYKDRVINPIDLGVILKKENVIKERCNLYLDVLMTFFNNVCESYLGREYMKTNEDIQGHFEWCYNKTINEFKEEGINFESIILREYLWDYTLFMVYTTEETPDLEFFDMNWKFIMEFTGVKTKNALSEMLYIYKLFDDILDTKRK